MHQTDFCLVKKMNINSDAIIVNQCDKNEYFEIRNINNTVRMFSVIDRGLSKSRNFAIDNSEADICVLADDDLRYYDDYKINIIKGFEKYPDADIIAFEVPSTNEQRPTSKLKEGRVNFLSSMKISSYQITFKRKSFKKNDIRFNELFGAGSRYSSGEENILLTKSIKKGLKVYFINTQIATVSHNESTWFNGFDEKLFRTKGAMFYEMNNTLSLFLILQFAIRKCIMYRDVMTFGEAVNKMLEGRGEYKNLFYNR
jgi:glycosyltransferase involved in cell wall biosynthesis